MPAFVFGRSIGVGVGFDQSVVGGTDECGVVHAGRAADGPGHDVVGFAVTRFPITPGKTQPRSRTAMAWRRSPVNNRVVRPTSRIWESDPSTTGRMSASHANRRASLGLIRVLDPINVAPATLRTRSS